MPRELGRLKHLIEIELTDTPLGESLHLTPTSVKVEGAASGVANAPTATSAYTTRNWRVVSCSTSMSVSYTHLTLPTNREV